jgi:hypothetical protein
MRQSLILQILLSGCSGLEESEQEKIRELNAHGEYIYRHHEELLYPTPAPKHRTRDPYAWEKSQLENSTVAKNR